MSNPPDTNDVTETSGTVFELLDRELWLLTTDTGEARNGLICTFVSKASIVPELPRMAVGLAKQHHTCELVQRSGRMCLHLLWPDQLDLVWRFALASGRDTDKFAGLDTAGSPLGNPLLPTALAWLDCRVETTLDMGDRTLFVAAVEHAASNGHSVPLSVNRLYYEAPDEQRERLIRMYRNDGQVDARAIRAWRARRDEATDA